MEEYDLLIIADATASMSSYLHSLKTSLPQIISVSALTGCFSRIGLLAYRDYCDDDLLEWSGWLDHNEQENGSQQPDLVGMAKQLDARGGGDYPEAIKTALAKAYEVMRPDAKTLILLYTDAPPHPQNPDFSTLGSGHRFDNAGKEGAALSVPAAYGGFGHKFVDWVFACNTLRKGEKQAQVFAILGSDMSGDYASYYNYLCTMTRGACIYLRDSRPQSISRVTVDLLLAWMGVEKTPGSGGGKEERNQTLPADLTRYISIEGIKHLAHEFDNKYGPRFLPITMQKHLLALNYTTTQINVDIMKRYLPKKKTPIMNFAEHWKTDVAYKETAVKNLIDIIQEDVRAISLNPVFGTLWRAVCSDRDYPRRDELVTAFDHHINQIQNPEERAQMRIWLEESYDHTEELKAIINSVPERERFPCVFLDPTLSFAQSDKDASDTDDTPVSDLTRADLLEIGRSCRQSVLRRIGRILTQLTIVASESEMPAHIATTSAEQVPRIPLALAKEQYNREFWKVLFHLIVPGTRLSARPAALVAALSLKMGVTPLADSAASQMLISKPRWNDLSMPENWTFGCLTLLLDADEVYRAQREHAEAFDKPNCLIESSDRKLFEQLVAFKMLQLNLDTPLTARVPWTPSKAVAPIGPLATCKSCKYPRSVTIMGGGGRCGVCIATDHVSEAEKAVWVPRGVSRDATPGSEATWVECCVAACRAQYIVYGVDALNVRAKCHYCRSQGKIQPPIVDCKQCLSRMIWPKAYRPSSFQEPEFICPPCTSGLLTTSDIELTARGIATENTLSWLIHDAEDTQADLLKNQSLFQAVSKTGIDAFCSTIKLFPSQEPSLTHRQKPIRNSTDLVSTLQEMVTSRKTIQVDCSLCFSSFRPGTLHPACGRRGCFQRICNSCLASWYGLNAPGRIINTAALACPFCRRYPAARTLAKYGMGIQGLRGLADAVRNASNAIYAWCQECISAKEYMARSCARGAPPILANWTCYECTQTLERRRLEEEQQRAEQALTDAQVARDVDRAQEAERWRNKALTDLEAQHLRNLTPCPQCGTLTEKTTGCGHIDCPVCGADWCFFCGKAFHKNKIYRHLYQEHGGFFDDGFERVEMHQQVTALLDESMWMNQRRGGHPS